MALEIKTIDEEVTELADKYDELISPRTIFRSDNNKLYLVLRAYAAGKVGLSDSMLLLHQRFDPAACDEADLESIAKLVGTDKLSGKGSAIRIVATNSSTTEEKVLPAGDYKYASVSGEIFSFNIAVDKTIAASGTAAFIAISENVGSFEVSAVSEMDIYRDDGVEIPEGVVFSCSANAGYLGREAESNWEFRQRILTDADRADHIKELEVEIKNLPEILECNLEFNNSTTQTVFDGITLDPHDLLVVITGNATSELAELVMEAGLWCTKQVSADKVVYADAPNYINGKFPVYYTNHLTANFSLEITYKYDSAYLTEANVESAITALFADLMGSSKHIDIYSEKDAYTTASNLSLPNVEILSITLKNAVGTAVSYIDIPKTRVPNLTGITYTAQEAFGNG